MYGKIFDSIYDGTLRADWKALIVFEQLIVLADQDGSIDITPDALHGRTGIPLDIILHGIQYLSAPDASSRSQECEGRRIVLIDDSRPWGWEIVNYMQYRQIASYADKRENAKIRKRKQRAKISVTKCDTSQHVTHGHGSSRVSRHTDTDTDTDTKKIKPSKSDDLNFDLFWKNYPRKDNKKKARLAFNALTEKKQLKAIADSKVRFVTTEKKFIPMPTSYLHGERWEDDTQDHDTELFGFDGI